MSFFLFINLIPVPTIYLYCIQFLFQLAFYTQFFWRRLKITISVPLRQTEYRYSYICVNLYCGIIFDLSMAFRFFSKFQTFENIGTNLNFSIKNNHFYHFIKIQIKMSMIHPEIRGYYLFKRYDCITKCFLLIRKW